MIYAQIKSGQKLHLAYEAGEGPDSQHLVQRGRSPFAIMADQIDAAYTEIKAARAALSKPYLSGL